MSTAGREVSSESWRELEELFATQCAPLNDLESAPPLGRQNSDFVIALDDGEVITSDNRRCSDWVAFGTTGVTTSRAFTHEDVAWLECAAGCGPGEVFRMLREDEDPTSLPWEPMARYAAFAPMLKERRGSKSTEHEAALRRSDPTSNPRTWIDWAQLKDDVAAAEAARARARSQARLPPPAPPPPKAAKEKLDVWPSISSHDKGQRDSSDTVLAMLPLEEIDDESPYDDDAADDDDDYGAQLCPSATTDARVCAARATAAKLSGSSNMVNMVICPPYLEPNYF